MSTNLQLKIDAVSELTQLESLKTNTVADYICHYLTRLGIKYVFGLPGGTLEPFFSALARSERAGGLRVVGCRHEAGAAFMADGYARETGKIGVCCATTGPGASNMMTGVAAAYLENIPMLVITAQTATQNMGKAPMQDSSCTGINTLDMFACCTRYNSLISDARQIEYKLNAAVRAAYFMPTKGPAHLTIPNNVLREALPKMACELNFDIQNQSVIFDAQATASLQQRLAAAKQVVFLLGPGAAGSVNQILMVAAQYRAKLLTTPNAKGLISCYHPDYYGVYGLAGHDAAYRLLCDPEVDLLVAIACRLDEFSSNGWDSHALSHSRLVHVDNNSEHFFLSPMASLHVYGTISEVFDRLIQPVDVVDMRSTAWEQALQPLVVRNPSLPAVLAKIYQLPSMLSAKQAYCLRNYQASNEANCFATTAPIKPQHLMYQLSCLFPPSTRFLADAGNSTFWAIHCLQPKDRRISRGQSQNMGMLRTCLSYMPMGWAIGGAIGTALGCSGSPVVAIIGDGSALMNGQELTVALQQQLTVIFVILNDGAYGAIKHGQRMSGAEAIGYQLPPVDFRLMAQAMGIDAYRIEQAEQFDHLNVDEICSKKSPTLLDVVIDSEESPPLGLRIKTLSPS